MMASTEHRPWPLPASPWTGSMVWSDLLFAHWPVDVDALRAIMPVTLPPETYDRRAWLTISPLYMSEVRPRGVPSVPRLSEFPELNVRTYVSLEGKPGIYFFSLDAGSLLAVAGARAAFHLPYFLASMSISHEAGYVHFTSHRSRWHGSEAHFVARYRPTRDVFHAAPGSLDEWLTERYCLYAIDSGGRLYRAEIHHARWPLQPAEAQLFRNTMTGPLGVRIPDTAPLLHYCQRLPVVSWMPARVEPAAPPPAIIPPAGEVPPSSPENERR
ncbi:MAG: hypothetical protein AMXMBFR13_48280 [Phycisphaerae bacterium]